jgi:hypothetical protein
MKSKVAVSQPPPINPNSYYLEGYATTTTPDRDGERCSLNLCKLFHDLFQKGGVTVTKGHDGGDTYGVVCYSRLEEKGVWVRVLLEDPSVNDEIKKLIHKLDIGETFGFSIVGAKHEHDHTDCITTFTSCTPVGLGLAPYPSNPDCIVRMVKPKVKVSHGLECRRCGEVMVR